MDDFRAPGRILLPGILLAFCLSALTGTAKAQPVSPRDGGRLPEAYYRQVEKDRAAYTFRRAWFPEARKVRRNLRALEEGRLSTAEALDPSAVAVSGTHYVPVLLGKYSNTGTAPFPKSSLQTELFDGPFSPRTMTEFYSEISGGRITLTGTVYPWVTAPNTDTYYAGSCNGLSPSCSNLGEFLKAVLDGNDGAVDFGLYDNDGPDGIPNSGDDDGFVDFVSFVQPEAGAECGGNNNVWSHRWVYSAWWEGVPYTTNDPAAGGGFIKVDDYTIQPIYACAGGMIEIGVFCHEFGHAFGLPDLYDTDGGSSGIGHWGLMGSGNWQSPTSPAHMCAWSKAQLGWVDVTEVGSDLAVYNVPAVETSGEVFKLSWTTDRFRRATDCAIAGSYSMWVGTTQGDASTMNWNSSSTPGYGNGWDESVSRDFFYDGSGSVTIGFSYAHELEPDYDYVYLEVTVGGTTSVVRTYNGVASGTDAIDLTPYLTPSAPYTVSFHFVSDVLYSDQDGLYPTSCGAFTFDDVTVMGGGETYFSDFESHEDGWYQDPVRNPPKEYFLVENRQKLGSDVNLHGAGIAIWHIDDNLTDGPYVNAGGPGNNQPHGVKLEEADNLWQLYSGTNRGDGGDIYPGITANTLFAGATSPSSKTNALHPSGVLVSLLSGSSTNMSVEMVSGDDPPALVAILPTSAENDTAALPVTLDGSGIRWGATWKLVKSGEPEIPASNVEWVGTDRVQGEVDLVGAAEGEWDVVLQNLDGQTDTLPGAFEVTDLVAVHLAHLELNAEDNTAVLRWTTGYESDTEGFHVLRSEQMDGPFGRVNPELIPARGGLAGASYEYRDAEVRPGGTYFYKLEEVVIRGEGLVFGPYQVSIPAAFALEQNRPNPFNPTTTIQFVLPVSARARLTVFDPSGRRIRTLVDGFLRADRYRAVWDGRDESGRRVGSGVYFYRLEADDFHRTRKMILLK
jgi:M6 family metalloprotease-like protein